MYQDGMQGAFNTPPPPMPMPSGGTASSTGDNPNVPVAHYNPATAVPAGSVGVAAPRAPVHPVVHALMGIGQQMGLLPPPTPPPAPPDPWSSIFGNAITKALGLQPQGQAGQVTGGPPPAGAPPGLQANTLPYLGGAQTGNIPNAQPGQLQTQPLGGPGLDPNQISTEGDASKAILNALGVNPTPGMINAMTNWMGREEGSWKGTPTPDRFNPLNTGMTEPGMVNNNLGGGTISYPNWQTGVKATADTIRQANMAPILRALQSGDPSQLGAAVAQTPWAEAHYQFNANQPNPNAALSPALAQGNFPVGSAAVAGGAPSATASGGGASSGGGGGGGAVGGTTAGGGGGRGAPSQQMSAAINSMMQIPLLAGQMDASSILQNPILSQIMGGGGAGGIDPNDPYNFIDQILGGQ